MGRPRDAVLDETIVGAAWSVLADFGYLAMSMEEVAQRAGCGRAALYRRYSGKRDLVLELVDRAIREADLSDGIEQSPREALVARLEGYVAVLTGPFGGVRAALSAARTIDVSLAEALDMLYKKEIGPYELAMRRAIGRPIDSDKLEKLIDSLIGVVSFRVGDLKRTLNRSDLEVLVDAVIETGRRLSSRPVAPT
jgi:AcrR family transcriptional regulator